MANRVVHFEIEAKDLERVKKFYTAAFDWELDQMGEEMGSYVVVKTGPTTEPGGINGGIFVSSPEEHETLNAYSCVISVDNIDEAMEKVKSAGGQVLSDKMEIPTVGTYAKCKDTEGNNFSLLQPAADMPSPTATA